MRMKNLKQKAINDRFEYLYKEFFAVVYNAIQSKNNYVLNSIILFFFLLLSYIFLQFKYLILNSNTNFRSF